MPIEVTDANYDEIVEKAILPVILDFWAEWCGPCREVTKLIDEIAPEYEGKIVFGKVNVDHCPTLTATFKVRNIPTVVFLKSGTMVDKTVGSIPKATFVAKLNEIL
jgi:thioredoxin 1